jgi:beta-galactosidase
VAARLDEATMKALYEHLLTEAGIAIHKLPEGVERHTRTADGVTYTFYLNCTGEQQCVEGVQGTDLLTGSSVDGTLILEKYGVAVFQS